MEQLELATADQKLILDLVSKEPFFSSFYFTGGTALSYFYLKHRYSDDLDFFSEKPFDMKHLLDVIKAWSKKYDFTVEANRSEHMDIFNLTFPKDIKLKVDFVHDPHKRIEEGIKWKSFPIDSLLDIATNKLLTINQRTSAKDFVDLFFLLQTHSLYDLMEGVKVKFGIKLDTILIASDMMKVKSFTFLPRMIKPLTLGELQTFFRSLAVELGKQVVE